MSNRRTISSGVHHVSINVDDVEVARQFYVDGLGFEELDRPDLGFGGAWLGVGEQELHLLDLPPPPARGQHFALLVDDLDAAIATLSQRGIEVDRTTEIAGVCRQAFVHDPAGNQVELNERL